MDGRVDPYTLEVAMIRHMLQDFRKHPWDYVMGFLALGLFWSVVVGLVSLYPST